MLQRLLVAILKSRVEEKMESESGSNRYSCRTLLTRNINSVLNKMEYETESLRLTYHDILADIRKNNGGHTNFYFF